MSNVEVRPARREDFDDILKIERLSFPSCWMTHFLKSEFDQPVSRVWTACISGESVAVAGYLAAARVLDELHILQIAVHPSHLRKGIARSMLNHAIGKEKYLRAVHLEVRERNRNAIEFYKAMKFKIVGERPRYYSDTGETAILFTRWIY